MPLDCARLGSTGVIASESWTIWLGALSRLSSHCASASGSVSGEYRTSGIRLRLARSTKYRVCAQRVALKVDASTTRVVGGVTIRKTPLTRFSWKVNSNGARFAPEPSPPRSSEL